MTGGPAVSRDRCLRRFRHGHLRPGAFPLLDDDRAGDSGVCTHGSRLWTLLVGPPRLRPAPAARTSSPTPLLTPKS